MRGYLALCLCMFLAACTGTANAPAVNMQDVTAKANALMTALMKTDYESASGQLQYPPKYTPEQLKADRQRIGDWLQVLEDELGRIQSSSQAQSEGKLYRFKVEGGGKGFFPQKQSSQISRTYEVYFSRAGKGYVTVMVSTAEGRAAVESIEYALPEGTAGAKEKIALVEKKTRQK